MTPLRAKHWQNLDNRFALHRRLSDRHHHQGRGRDARGCATRWRRAGIPIENSKGEWGPGQEEINVRYAEALEMADRHVILKNGAKEIAQPEGQGDHLHGQVATTASPATSSHIHNSLWSAERQDAALLRQEEPSGRMSKLDAAMGGRPAQICPRISPASWRPTSTPTSASRPATWAPTRAIIWSRDNRTAGFRLCGEGTKAHPHGMPHRRRRPQPLPGLRGADRRRPRRHRREARAAEAASRATPTTASSTPEIPKTLRDATEAWRSRRCCARRSATTWSTTTSTPPNGNSSSMTAASPTGNCTRFRAVLRARSQHLCGGLMPSPRPCGRRPGDGGHRRLRRISSMTETIKLNSPIDGSIYAERPVATDQAGQRRRRARRAAQVEWAKTPIADARQVYARHARGAGRHDRRDRAGARLADGPPRAAMAASSAASRSARTTWSRSPRGAGARAGLQPEGRASAAIVKKDPLGVVMVIAPWNYPYLTAVNTIVPALMAGTPPSS